MTYKFFTIKNMKEEQGFTLIELLIVIAVLGVLAAALLVAINPTEQLARGRDAGRVSTINQLGRAVQSYYTANSAFLAQSATWIDTLVTSKDIKIAPSNPTGGTGYVQGCNTATVAENGICYLTSGTDAIVYVTAESSLQKTKCTAGQGAWITWSSAQGSTGIACTTNATTDPVVGVTGLK